MTIDTNYYSVLAFNIPGNGFQDSLINNYNDFHTGDIARLFFRVELLKFILVLLLQMRHSHLQIGLQK